ncbi:MAG: SDR family oxidoreductase [Candidatus Kerfeldbacteria bacterium]|nr:SDR family oxidoreductase [Candidatus Kerfeldbacteria bacterium]
MKPLVIGATGMVGGYLYSRLQSRGLDPIGTSSVTESGYRQLDLRNRDELVGLIDDVQPSMIFLAAAQTNVEYCEEHPAESRAVNVAPVAALAEHLRDSDVPFVFFSSDYVFDGQAGPYRETDAPNPISEYGRQKFECEQILLKALPKTAIIPRITVVYGWEREGKNFVVRLIRNLKNGETARVPSDQINSPSYAGNVAQAAIELALQRQSGIFHTSGPEVMDRYAFAQAVCDVYGLDQSLIQPITTPELKQKAPRPLKAGMIVEKAQALLSFPLLNAHDGLTAMREEDSPWNTSRDG